MPISILSSLPCVSCAALGNCLNRRGPLQQSVPDRTVLCTVDLSTTLALDISGILPKVAW